MTDVICFNERQTRLGYITDAVATSESYGLVAMLPIAEAARARIRSAMNIFLWECLSYHYPEDSFVLTDDMLASYTEQVLGLPNITPNGLVLPKAENQLGFNMLQKESIAAFDSLGLGKFVDRLQWPVNIRLQSGTPNAEVDSRPRASVKPHSDIWAGDPAAGLMCFLAVLGDTQASGIDFLQPTRFPKSFVRTLDDYLEGAELAEGAKKVAEFDDRGWYLVDPYLLHQTTKNRRGYRISIDFRLISSLRVDSDIDEDESRKDWFIDYESWRQVGTKNMVVAEEHMHDFKVDNQQKFTIGYPTRIQLRNQGTKDEPHLTAKTG